jgi:hypothetical protein
VRKSSTPAELLDTILSYTTVCRDAQGSHILREIVNLGGVDRAFYKHIHGDTLAAQELYLAPKPKHSTPACILAAFGFPKDDDLRVLWLANDVKSRLMCRGVQSDLDFPPLPHVSFEIRCSDIKQKSESWKTQSWSEMFFVQPPTTEIWTEIRGTRGSTQESLQTQLGLVRRAKSIKLSDVIKTTNELSERFEGVAERAYVLFSTRLNAKGELWDREKGFRVED